MNGVLIVLPILTLMMFQLGLTLRINDFLLILKKPLPVLTGLLGQIIMLPVVAFLLARAFNLTNLMFTGLVLIACCPGGSSSNMFSYLAKGDTALSVSLTALSSIITLFTLPFVMNFAVKTVDIEFSNTLTLPVGNLIIQNILLVFLPVIVGMVLRAFKPVISEKIEKKLAKLSFPLLMFLALIFFIQNFSVIMQNFLQLGLCVFCLLICVTFLAFLLSKMFALKRQYQRTIIIEVGMQNAAQAIAIASSPFIFNNNTVAVPAIVYALVMNIVLLVYVGKIKYFGNENSQS